MKKPVYYFCIEVGVKDMRLQPIDLTLVDIFLRGVLTECLDGNPILVRDRLRQIPEHLFLNPTMVFLISTG